MYELCTVLTKSITGECVTTVEKESNFQISRDELWYRLPPTEATKYIFHCGTVLEMQLYAKKRLPQYTYFQHFSVASSSTSMHRTCKIGASRDS